MNANELADDLNDIMDVLVGGGTLDKNTIEEKLVRKAATMLREQQAQIELLNAKLAYMFEQELKSAKVNK